MKLIYTPKAGFVGPPAPWPGRDHEEPDNAMSTAKFASGFYRSESGKEIRERRDREEAGKKVANQKAADGLAVQATEARATAVQATSEAEEAEARAEAKAPRRRRSR